MDQVRSVEGDTIELIIYNHYGRQDAKLLDKVLYTDGNEKLPAHGIFLTPGTIVNLPDIPVTSETRTLTRLQNLWD